MLYRRCRRSGYQVYLGSKMAEAVDFLMNDKCAAGTGKFIEVMANRLGLTIEELFEGG